MFQEDRHLENFFEKTGHVFLLGLRDHLAQFCGFIYEHAETLEVHDHWGTWSFAGGIEAHLSPSQLPDMGRSQCSGNQLAAAQVPVAALRKEVGCGVPLRTPQVKAPKMPLQRTDPHSHTVSEPLWAQPGHVTLMAPSVLSSQIHMSGGVLIMTVCQEYPSYGGVFTIKQFLAPLRIQENL